ncbi:MAG: DUF1345 domain-containing protein [Ilumatobacteraceae bacterium]
MTEQPAAVVPERAVSARRRLYVCAGIGLAAGSATAFVAPWQLAVLVGWNAAAALLLVWIVLEVGRLDADGTRRRAEPEDNSHRGPVMIVTAAAIVSLGGMAFGLVHARRVGQLMEVLLTVASVTAVVLSWAVVHLVYALRYAHLYYRTPSGGIDFHQDEPPDYRDFVYMAFTVGMSFAVSDTDIGDRSIRRAVAQHALVSYLFGAVIVGLIINVMAGFVR